MTIFFTSDLHLGHARVIEYSARPFSSIEEMDAALIKNWNEVVRDQDVVYVLGDFVLCPAERALAYLAQLRGRKHIVFGNHDRRLRDNQKFLMQFESHADLRTISVPDSDGFNGMRPVVLCHFAMRTWDRSHYGSFSLHGHSHGTLPDDPHSLSLDVGVDAWDYRPVAYEQIRQRMALKTWKPIDKHGEER